MFMTDPVPMFDLSRQYECLQKELESAAVDVLRSTVYVGGKEVEALEREIAERIGARGVVALSSGTDALLVALMAHCVGPGDLVAVPTYSFFATAGVVVRLGARPVFVDIDPVTCNITPETLDAAMAPYADQGKLRAVIPVHLYGLCADIEALRAAAAKYGEDVGILEDAAQAIDAQFADGTFAGTKGLAGCFSTYPTKNLGGLGDGGFLSFEDEDYGGRVRAMRNHGQTDQYRHELIGGNFRMDALQAALLRVKLRHLSTMTERRKANAARYRELFAGPRPGRQRAPAARRRRPLLPPVRRAPPRGHARPGEERAARAGHRHRDLLPAAVPPPAVLPAPRRPRGRPAERRGRLAHLARAADLPRAARRRDRARRRGARARRARGSGRVTSPVGRADPRFRRPTPTASRGAACRGVSRRGHRARRPAPLFGSFSRTAVPNALPARAAGRPRGLVDRGSRVHPFARRSSVRAPDEAATRNARLRCRHRVTRGRTPRTRTRCPPHAPSCASAPSPRSPRWPGLDGTRSNERTRCPRLSTEPPETGTARPYSADGIGFSFRSPPSELSELPAPR
jgi:dTDP-4-amino-4,6-dideoxygalactose transaminase